MKGEEGRREEREEGKGKKGKWREREGEKDGGREE